MGEAQIALLVDVENVGLGPIRALLDQLSDLGRITIRRAYGDWSKGATMRDQLLQLGLEPIHVFRSSASGKNSSDIKLVIDAVELLFRSPVDTFVVASSDSDFVPLVMTLRAAGKQVIGAGRRGVVSPTLVTSCDRYIFLGEEEAAPQPVRARLRAVAGHRGGVAEERTEPKEEAVSLMLRAFHAAMDDEGKVSGSRLLQTMSRIDPSFDFRALGSRTFAHFLESTGEVTVTRARGLGDMEVELKGAPAPTAPRPEPTAAPEAGPSAFADAHQGRMSRPEPAAAPETGPVASDDWDVMLAEALDKRAHQTGRDQVSGAWTAEQAAKFLGASSLKSSRYPTLRKLLDGSDYLRARWSLDGGRLVRTRNDAEPTPMSAEEQD